MDGRLLLRRQITLRRLSREAIATTMLNLVYCLVYVYARTYVQSIVERAQFSSEISNRNVMQPLEHLVLS